MADICTVCHKEMQGGFEVYTREKSIGFHIVVDSTPDRDFNICVPAIRQCISSVVGILKRILR